MKLPNGRTVPGGKFGQADEADEKLELTEKEGEYEAKIVAIWKGILNMDVEDSTDFFASGAGSMDVVRLVEEVENAKNYRSKGGKSSGERQVRRRGVAARGRLHGSLPGGFRQDDNSQAA